MLKRELNILNISNPFLTGLREYIDVKFINSNANNSVSVHGFHYWTDSPDRVCLISSIRVKYTSAEAEHLPDILQLELEAPHQNIDHGDAQACPYTGVGMLSNGTNVDVRLDYEHAMFRTVIKIVMENNYIPLTGEEVEITTEISYSLKKTTESFITPIVKLNYEMENDTIIISNTSVKDSINIEGNLELNEYYDFTHYLSRNYRYDSNKNVVFVDYASGVVYDHILIYNFEISNDPLSNTSEPEIIATYDVSFIVTQKDVYESIEFPDYFVPATNHILNVVGDQVIASIRYLDFTSTLGIYAPIDPDTILVTVHQPVPNIDSQDSTISYQVIDQENMIQLNVTSPHDMISPSTTYLRINTSMKKTIETMLNTLHGFRTSESDIVHELGEFKSVSFTVDQFS
jgi:hypothetical protein